MTVSDKLILSLIQSTLSWEDIDSNISMFEQKISSIDKSDIIVLPEMFTTGFTNSSAALAEEMDGKTCQWMKKMAVEKKAAICGSIIIKENNQYFNRLVWVEPDGSMRHYDKKHLFAMAGEHNHYTAGSKKEIFLYKGWRINLQICYDLRFPTWSRRVCNEHEDYDLIIYVANWPKVRSHAWSSLLIARAIENQAYCVGVNRVGTDGSGLEYSGNSVLLDSLGSERAATLAGKEDILQCEINHSDLMTIRKKLPFYKDQDSFVLS